MFMKQEKFKTYSRQQIPLLPATYEDKIAAEHLVRIVDAVIDSIDLKELYRTYKGGGTSSDNKDAAKSNHLCLHHQTPIAAER